MKDLVNSYADAIVSYKKHRIVWSAYGLHSFYTCGMKGVREVPQHLERQVYEELRRRGYPVLSLGDFLRVEVDEQFVRYHMEERLVFYMDNKTPMLFTLDSLIFRWRGWVDIVIFSEERGKIEYPLCDKWNLFWYIFASFLRKDVVHCVKFYRDGKEVSVEPEEFKIPIFQERKRKGDEENEGEN